MSQEEAWQADARVIRRLLARGDGETLSLLDRYQNAAIDWQTRAIEAQATIGRLQHEEHMAIALRESGITADDASSIASVWAAGGRSGADRIVPAMRAIERWLRTPGREEWKKKP